jgi:hypothetical protein
VRGKTKEVGLKGDVFQRKLTYTLGFYDIKRVNAAYAWSPDVLSQTQLEDLINPNNVLPGSSNYVTVVNGLNNERRTVNSNEQARGVELTLQGQRWKGLQTRVTFSTSKVRAQADFSQFRTYLSAAEARTAAATAPATPQQPPCPRACAALARVQALARRARRRRPKWRLRCRAACSAPGCAAAAWRRRWRTGRGWATPWRARHDGRCPRALTARAGPSSPPVASCNDLKIHRE